MGSVNYHIQTFCALIYFILHNLANLDKHDDKQGYILSVCFVIKGMLGHFYDIKFKF